MQKKMIITIARQYGSGGREIGEQVGKLLGIPVYGKELITLSAQKGEINQDVLERVDESAANSLLYTLAVGSNTFGTGFIGYNMPINDRLFILQSDVIRQLAEQEERGCVFIGRCADYVLRKDPHRLSVFVYADLEQRKERIAARNGISGSAVIDAINKTDRRRSSYYNFYTGGKWGKYDNYHLAVNSSCLGIERTAALIADFARLKSE